MIVLNDYGRTFPPHKCLSLSRSLLFAFGFFCVSFGNTELTTFESFWEFLRDYLDVN